MSHASPVKQTHLYHRAKIAERVHVMMATMVLQTHVQPVMLSASHAPRLGRMAVQPAIAMLR